VESWAVSLALGVLEPLLELSCMRAPTEAEIRACLYASLAMPTGMLIHEMGVKRGKYRVDVARVMADSLHCFEIKSAADTLKRLPDQAKHFSQVFHECTLVAASSHILKGAALVPPWWGIVQVSSTTPVTLEVLRPAGLNPKLNMLWFVRLLWKEELESIARDRKFKGWSRLTHAKLAEFLRRRLPEDELVKLVVTTIRARKDWRLDDAS
jgi:hypothetical protein